MVNKDQIELKYSIKEDLPNIGCRSQQIQQVIMNLLTNARDALNQKYQGYDKNKIMELSCINIKKYDENWIRITVKDYGLGIPKKIQDKIFDPFFTTKSRDEGTGLGLSISYGIVKEHHGELSFKTKAGAYTQFYLDLPVDNGWDAES